MQDLSDKNQEQNLLSQNKLISLDYLLKQEQDISDKNQEQNLFFEKKLSNKFLLSKQDGSPNNNNNKTNFLNKKFLRFITIKNDKKKIHMNGKDNEIGRWTKEEREKFIEGISLYGTNWKKIDKLIKSRTSSQIRSHAQKFFIKLKSYKNLKLGIDFTSNSINSIKDMINHIKYINKNYDIKNLFLFLLKQYNKRKRNINKNCNKITNKIYNKETDKEDMEDNKIENIINRKVQNYL